MSTSLILPPKFIDQHARALRARATTVAALLVTVVGCNYQSVQHVDRATVSGRVTFGEEPLRGGSVTFISTTDASKRATGVLKPDGTFSITDVPIGPARVAIDTEPMRFGAPDRYVQIPVRYVSPETSGFTFDVQPGENTGAKFQLEK